jgi:hypothetical protein
MEILQFKEDIFGKTPNEILTSSYFNMRSIRAKGAKLPPNRAIQYLEEKKAAQLLRETAKKIPV